MNVNGVTPQPTAVYLPMQAIAPSVPNDHPLAVPIPDRKADPTPSGEPFVRPTAAAKTGGHGERGGLDKSAMVTPPTERPAVVAKPVERPSVTEQITQQVAARMSSVHGFDAYA